MKLTIFTLLLICTFTLSSCTQNQRAKNFGGTATIELPKGKKLINVTYKNDDIWYLTKPMVESDKPETYEFNEESSFGIFNGTVIIKESR